MSITIIWSAVLQDADAPCVKRRTTQIMSIATPAPEDAAATALKWWLEEDEPNSCFRTNWDTEADDATEFSGHVVIHEPPEASGCYDVQMERVIQARGYPADPSDQARVLAVLAESEAS